MIDRFYDLFLLAAVNNGKTLYGEEEWKVFFTSIVKSGLLNTNRECKDVETIWLEQVASSRSFIERTATPPTPELSFADFQNRIIANFQIANGDKAVLSASAVKLQAQNLASLVDAQDPKAMDEEKIRQLLSVMLELEGDHLHMQHVCEQLTSRIEKSMEDTALKALTGSRRNNNNINNGSDVDEDGEALDGNSNDTTKNDLPNPLMFYITNLAMIEKASIKHKVRSVRYSGTTSESRGRVTRDTYNFGKNFTGIQNIHAYKTQGTNKGKLVECITLVCPKTKVPPAALASIWDCYSAHKGLALSSTCVPHAMGVDDDDHDLCFCFEHIPARSMSSMIYEKRISQQGYKITERSILYKHWARELLIR